MNLAELDKSEAQLLYWSVQRDGVTTKEVFEEDRAIELFDEWCVLYGSTQVELVEIWAKPIRTNRPRIENGTDSDEGPKPVR